MCRDLVLGKVWALKVRKKGETSEGRLLSRLSHPGIPPLADWWEEAEREYLIMEYISGQELGAYALEHGPSQARVLTWGRELCKILAYLHSQVPPVIHSDVKPANVLLSKEGRLYLVDFGAARRGFAEKSSLGRGTGAFAAPEQKEGRAFPQTDLYGLGKTLEALLGAKRPSRRVRKILQKCGSEKRKQRYLGAEELEEDLQKALEGLECRHQARWWPAAVLLAGLAAGLLSFRGVSRGLEQMGRAAEQEEGNLPDPVKDGEAGGAFGERAKETVRESRASETEGSPSQRLGQVLAGLRKRLMEAARQGRSLEEEKIWGELWELAHLVDENLTEKEKKEALFFLGSLYRGLGMEGEAYGVYRRMVQNWPLDLECRAGLGMTLLRQGKRGESLALYQRGRSLKDTDGNYRIWEQSLEVNKNGKKDKKEGSTAGTKNEGKEEKKALARGDSGSGPADTEGR